MLEETRTKVWSLVRTSRLAQIPAALLVILLIALTVYVFKAQTIVVAIDGKKVQVTTIWGTVGDALKYSGLGIYPEDIVKPSRETSVSKGLEVEVIRSKPVVLKLEDKVLNVRTPAKTVGEALRDLSERYALGIKEVDEVNFDRGETVVADMELEVKRSVPISVRADGKEFETYLAPRTVEEALKKLGITLGEKDKVSLPLDHLLEAHDQIQVVRVTEKVETITSEIPYQVVAQPADFPLGLPDRIVKKGVNGLHEQTVKITLADGKEVDRQILEQRVIRPPVNQIVARGAQTSISRGGRTINFKRAYLMRASAYSDSGSGSVTATGVPVRWGVVAVDPRVIPLGTQLYVEGYGDAVALDTGGAIRGNRIDLYMDSEEAAYSWGVRTVVVYVK